MLKIDFDGTEVDIEDKFNKTFELTLITIINLNLVNKLKNNTLQHLNISNDELTDLLSFGNVNKNMYFSKEIEEKYNIDAILAGQFIYESFENNINRESHSDQEVLFIEGAKEAIIENFKVEHNFESSSDGSILDIFSRDINFIENDITHLTESIEIIEKSDSENKSKIKNLIIKSFSRTIASYIDSLSKEFISSLFSNCQYYIVSLLDKKTNIHNESKQRIDALIDKSVLGNKLSKIILDFYDFKEDENCKIYLKHKKSYEKIKSIIDSRNEIMHHYNPKEAHYLNIMKYWGEYSKHLISLYEEYNYETNDGYKSLEIKLIEKINKISSDDDYVSKTLIPLYFERFM